MTIRPLNADLALPLFVTKCLTALTQEARDLKAALDEYAESAPDAGCLYQQNVTAAKRADPRVPKVLWNLPLAGQNQSRLILANAYDPSELHGAASREQRSDVAVLAHDHVAKLRRGSRQVRVALDPLHRL